MSRYRDFVRWTEKNNWGVVKKEGQTLNLNKYINLRYKDIPSGYKEFLEVVKQLVSPNKKTWFICEDEYNGNSDVRFKWNEYELVSLEAAGDDEVWKEEITSWWDNYLPIVMSVDNGYSFYAIDLTFNKGAIVKGEGPEFEEVEEVASNIEEFIETIMINKIQI